MDGIKQFFEGKKTLIAIMAGLGAFLTAVAQTLADGFQLSDIQLILGAFAALMAVIGIGDKANRILKGLGK